MDVWMDDGATRGRTGQFSSPSLTNFLARSDAAGETSQCRFMIMIQMLTELWGVLRQRSHPNPPPLNLRFPLAEGNALNQTYA